MNKRSLRIVCILLVAVMLLTGCTGKRRTYTESSIAFLDNVASADSSYVLLWQDDPTEYKRMTSVVNVLVPTWLYVDAGAKLMDITARELTVDYASYVQKANADNINVWAAVECFDADQAKTLVSGGSEAEAFIETLTGFVETSGVNGIVLDFETMDPADKALYTSFVKAVGDALPDDVLLSVCVTFMGVASDDEDWSKCYDHQGLAEVSDLLIVQAYEQYGKTSDKEGPLCSYEWLYNNILKLLAVVPSQQLLLMLPFYGRDYRFNAEDASAAWIDDESKAPVVSLKQVEELYEQKQYYDSNGELSTSKDSNIEEVFDKNYRTPYTKFTDIEGSIHVIWYENQESILEKSSLAVEYGFAGIGAYDSVFSNTKLWKGVRSATDAQYFSCEMMTMLRESVSSVTVYDPDYEENYDADATGINRMLNLLSICTMAESSGVDTGYVLKLVVGESEKTGQKLRFAVKEKNGRYVLVPDNEYTGIVTAGLSMWLPEGMTPDMLVGISLIWQENADKDAPKDSEKPATSDEQPITSDELPTESVSPSETEPVTTDNGDTADAPSETANE